MSAAAFHRAVAIDTRISVAVAELRVGSRIDRALAARLGIDLAPVIATLEGHLDTLRAELNRITDDPYPQQPGASSESASWRAALDQRHDRVAERGEGEMRQQILERDRWADDGGAPCGRSR